MRRFLLISLALFWLAASYATRTVWAQQQPHDEIDDERPLAFRPHLVLSSELQEEIRGMRALNRGEFYRMLSAINARTNARNTETRITKSVYWAALDRQQLAEGRAWLEFAHTASEPIFYHLAPSRLPLHGLHWIGSESRLVTAGSDARNRAVVKVDRNGTLACAWSLRSKRDPQGSLHFSTSLPASQVTHLVLDLPTGHVPSVDRGIVMALDHEPLDRYLPEIDFLDEVATAGERARWLIELGSHRTLTLQITPGDRVGEHRHTFLRETLDYDLTEAGIELRARLSLDVLGNPVRKLVLSSDPPLQVAAAHFGEQRLTVRRTEDPQQVEVELVEPLSGNGREITVTALAPAVMDSPWVLPSIHTQNVFWQEGTANLHVPGSLALKRLDPLGYVATNVERLPLPRAGEIRRFRAHSPAAQLKVIVGTPLSRVRIDAGTTLRVGDQLVTAKTIADVRCQQGRRFVLEARRARAWKIDSVETVPADALDGYETRGAGGSRLQVRLKQPVSSMNPVRIVIQASRKPPKPGPYSAADLRPIDFNTTPDREHIVSVSPEASRYLAVFEDSQVRRLSRDDLSLQQLERIDVLTAAIVYEDGPQASRLKIAPRGIRPGYSARISLESIAEPNRLRQLIVIRCEPESAQVSSVPVRLAPGTDQPINWTFGGDPDGILAARKLDGQQGDGDGATWEITLRQPTSETFELRATIVTPFASELTLPLASAPEASTQSGILRIGSECEDQIRISAPLLKGIPAEAHAPEVYSHLTAHYRYDPATEQEVTISRAEQNDLPSAAWIWSSRLVSRFEQNGRADHEAVLLLENTGLRRATIQLPAGVELQHVSVDRVELELPQIPSTRALNIELPSRRRFPVVRLRYRTKGAALGTLSIAMAPLPSTALPCVQQTWSVWLPPGYRTMRDTRLHSRARYFEPHWSDRLFGRTLMRRSSRPFNPLSVAEWSRLFRGSSDGAAARAARDFVRQITELERAETSNTWGELVAQYAAFRSRKPSGLPKLRIDGVSLAHSKITPSSLRSVLSAPSTPDELLAPENLALVAAHDTVLLTTIGALAQLGGETVPTDCRNLVLARGSESLRELLLPTRWLETSAATRWSASRAAPMRFEDAADIDFAIGLGWSNYEFKVANRPTVSVQVHSTSLPSVIELAALILMLGIERWLFKQRLRSLFIVSCVAAVGALLVPPDLIFVARGLFLGSLVAFWMALLIPTASQAVAPATTRTGWWWRTAGTAGVFIWIALLPHRLSLLPAAESAPARPSEKTPPFRVLFPIDEEKQPAGNYVYVPEALYDALHHRSSLAQDKRQGWLIETADYALELERRPGVDEIAVRKFVAVYDITTSEETARVKLPWRTAELLDARIDGMRVSPTLDANGRFVEFLLASGKSRLELSLQPVLQDEQSHRSFQLRIPRMNAATLTIAAPADMEDIEVLTSLGAVESHSEPNAMSRTVVAHLGPIDLLAVRFRHERVSQDDLPDTEVNQLLWFNVQPNAVSVEARLAFAVRSGTLDRARLHVDPRLELQPFGADQPVAGVEVSADSRTITIELDRAYGRGGEVTLKANFLCQRPPPLGQLKIPQLAAMARLPSQSWIAVSANDLLDVQLSDVEADQEIAPAEFLAAWQEPAEVPRLAFRSKIGNQTALLIHQQPAQTTVREEAEYTVSRDRIEAKYRGRVATSGGYRFQQRVSVPGKLVLTSATVLQANEDKTQSWSSDGTGHITVFFDAPLTGTYEVQLAGQMPIAMAESIQLPQLAWINATREIESVRVLRKSDVRLVVHEATGLAERHDGNEPPPTRLLRVAASFDRVPTETQQASVTVEVLPNQPRLTAQLELALSYTDGEWMVAAELESFATHGVLDFLRMSMPSELSEPLEVEPGIPYEIEVAPGTTNRVLTLMRPSAGQWPAKIHFRCRLSNTPDMQLQVPDLYVLDVTHSKRTLVLPNKIGAQQLTWRTAGLKSTPSRPSDDEGTGPVGGVTRYEQTGNSMRASVGGIEHASGEPKLTLADYRVACRQDGSVLGVAAFDILPARTRSCRLAMPPQTRLVNLSVAGLTSAAESLERGTWRFRLRLDEMPQRVEVVFLGTMTKTRGRLLLHVPRLVGLSPSQMLWTLRGSANAARIKAELRAVTAAELQRARLQATNRILDLSTELAARNPPSEFDIWQRAWLGRRDRIVAALASEQRTGNTGLISNELPTDGGPKQAALSNVFEKSETWLRATGAQGPAAHFRQQDGSAELSLRFEDAQRSDLLLRWLLAGVTMITAGAISLALNVDSLREWTVRWPYLAGVCLGIVYWLWFWPSFLGCILIGLFVWGGLRTPWRAHKG